MSKGLPYRSDILVPSQRLFAIRHNAPATMLLPSWIRGWHFKNITVTGASTRTGPPAAKAGAFRPGRIQPGILRRGASRAVHRPDKDFQRRSLSILAPVASANALQLGIHYFISFQFLITASKINNFT
jgi:hypothetical protein